MKGLSTPSSGIAYPEDMHRLKQLFDLFCKSHHIEAGSFYAEKIAQATMSLFQAGVSDEAEIRASLEIFHKRRIGRGGPCPLKA